VAFDGAFEMTSSILRVGTFAKQNSFTLFVQLKTNWCAPEAVRNALLDHAQFDFENLRQVFGTQRLEDHDFIDAVHELRRELARAASTAVRVIFSSSELSTWTGLGAKPSLESTRPFISAAPRLEVMMMMHLERSTRGYRPA